MIWSAEEIVRSYRMAADPKKQIKVLFGLDEDGSGKRVTDIGVICCHILNGEGLAISIAENVRV